MHDILHKICVLRKSGADVFYAREFFFFVSDCILFSNLVILEYFRRLFKFRVEEARGYCLHFMVCMDE